MAFPLHFGIVADMPMAMAWAVTDMLVHGHDLAATTGSDWVIDPDAAALALFGILPQMRCVISPSVLDGPDRDQPLRLRQGMPTIRLRAGGGAYVVTIEDDAAGSGVDPVELLLAITGRVKDPDNPVIADVASWSEPI